MTTTRLERKLGRAILKTMGDIAICPKDNIKAFMVLKRRLEREVKQFQNLTGRDSLGEELMREISHGY